MKIIRKRERVECVSYSRSFEYEDDRGAGFGFDCDKDGNVNVDALQPCAQKSYAACLAGYVDVMRGVEWKSGADGWEPVAGTGHSVRVRMLDMGVVEHHHAYNEPAIGVCECGAHVELHGFTNTCERCERDYNMSGQLLAPREQWGEETGETLDEILSIR